MLSGGQNQTNAAATSCLDRWSENADKLTKILGFFAQVVVIPLSALTAGYGWLREEELVMPGWLTWAFVGILALIGGTFIVRYFQRQKRDQWRLWKKVVVITLVILTLSLAGLLWYLKPPEPAWCRLDVPKLLAQPGTMQDFPILVMLDQLSGRNGLIPGGKTYEQLLKSKRGNAQLQEAWAGYLAPLIVPSTMPTTVSLRQGPNLGGDSASIGVVVIVWTHGDDGVKARAPQEFGYESLQTSVGVPVKLHRSERASMFVFVYPLDAAASRALPDRFADAISVK